MIHITPSQAPWTAAIIDPFDSSWDEKDLNIPTFLRYGIFRFFVAIGAFIILYPIYIKVRSKFIVISEFIPPSNKSIKKDLGLPNFSSNQTANTCYFNASMQMIYNLEYIKNLIRESTPDEGSFAFTLKQKIIDLLDNMKSGQTQGIKLAHQGLASYYVDSQEWKKAVTKNEQGGRPQDAMELIRFFFDHLKFDKNLFNNAQIISERKLKDLLTDEFLHNIQIKEDNSLPILVIDQKNSVQEAVNIMLKNGEPEALELCEKVGNDYKTFKIKDIFIGCAKARLSKEKSLWFENFLNKYTEFDLKDKNLKSMIFKFLEIENFDSAQSIFAQNLKNKQALAGERTEKFIIKPDTSLLIFEIAHLNRNGQLDRENGIFEPDESITINGEKWLLQGAINRPGGGHYTYLQKTGKTWTEFNDQIVTEKVASIKDISGKGTRLRSLIYQKT